MANTPVKIGFDGRALPKVFFGADSLPIELEAKFGNLDVTGNNMVVGWSEAQMMIREGLIK